MSSDINEASKADTKFKKFDKDKPSFSLMAQFSKQLGDVNNVLEYGAGKYGKDNWKQATEDDIGRYLDATIRHALALRKGEEMDDESKLGHAEHIIANMLFVKYLRETPNTKEMYGETNKIRKPK